MNSQEGLVLDESTHRYSYDGRRVSGCTECLAGVGIVDTSFFKEWHAQRGTAGHKAMELLVQGRLDWTSLDERIVGYVKAGEKFCRDVGIVIGDPRNLTEHLVFSQACRVAGRLDLYTELFGKMPTVVDWKLGAKGHAGLQLAFYADCLQEELRLKKAPRRIAVQLRPDGTYRMTEYKESRDLQHFCAAALIYTNYLMNKREDETDE